MTTKYEILFMIEVLNDYYSDLQCEDLEIVPTDETAAMLKGLQMLYKVIGNKMIIIVRIDDTEKPVIKIDLLKKLRFYIQIDNVHFGNFTNVTFQPLTSSAYYFSNINQNESNSTLYISSKIQQYNSATTYNIGDLSGDGSGNVYEAIKPSNSGGAHAVTDTNFWMPKGNFQYANAADILDIASDTYNFNAAPNTDFTIYVYALNTSTNTYDVQVLHTTQHYTVAQTSVPISLTGLTYGKYRIQVNGSSKYVYYDANAANTNILGIAEVFNYLSATNDFSLLDSTGAVKKPTFTLHFANRSVLWKYIARSSDVTAIKDNLSVYTFNNVAASTAFLSSVPIPFKDKPISTLYLESATLGNVTPVANPGSNTLSTVVQGSDTYYCAEKYLNY
ncbi:MAG TPA: hypothetical protein VN721_15875 [Flavipsychrobacter sp.]|nr:hypothetical protein [Flavipsychrobacter sp.]